MKPRLLDLFCGAGGAARGYQQAGFYVVGVDHVAQRDYCGDEIVRAQVADFIQEHGFAGFDAVHASPLWFRYARMGNHDRDAHGDDVTPIAELLRASGLPYVCESGTNGPLRETVMLCGASFGLEVVRHMFFETNVPLLVPPCAHEPGGTTTGRLVALGAHSVTRARYGRKIPPRRKASEWREAAGLDWMSLKQATLAVPPPYTEHLGHYLMAEIKARQAA